MRAIHKKTAAGTLLGTAVATAVAQAAEFSRDYTADWLPMPPAVAVPITVSLVATTRVSMPETILEDANEYRGHLERYGVSRITVPKRG